MGRTLVLYTFSKYNENVEYFIKNGVFEDEDVEFVFISNSMDKIPIEVKNIYYRENIGYDFGAWSSYLLQNDNYKDYDKFIFINSSVKGPFTNDKWTDLFKLDENIKLFGPTINSANSECVLSHQNSHVQSCVFSTDKIGLELLINAGVFSLNFISDKLEIINTKEIKMSRIRSRI